MWHIQIPGRISSELLMHCLDHQVIKGDLDLEGRHLGATWLREIDADVQSANINIHSARKKANYCVLWRHIINRAILHQGATELTLQAICPSCHPNRSCQNIEGNSSTQQQPLIINHWIYLCFIQKMTTEGLID